MTTQNKIPDGYRQDAKGNLVPVGNIREIDKLRDELVQELISEAKALQEKIRGYKRKAFADIAAFVELSAERYSTTFGGEKGNVTLYSFDGKHKIQRAINDHTRFDEGIQAAQSLIHECLDDWSEGANENLKSLVMRAFEVDKEGNLSTTRILALRRVQIDDHRWKQAMDAISDSVQIIGSKSYIRFYERIGESGQYAAIPLDIAGV